MENKILMTSIITGALCLLIITGLTTDWSTDKKEKTLECIKLTGKTLSCKCAFQGCYDDTSVLVSQELN